MLGTMGRAAKALPHFGAQMMEAGDGPCHSARFVEPFAKVLSTYDGYPLESLGRLKAIDPESRIPAAVANEWVVRQVERTGDVDLGLKAGSSLVFGQGGVLDYAMHSAATLGASTRVAHRFARLFSDVLDVYPRVEGHRAAVHIDIGPAVPRPVADFAMSAWFRNHISQQLRNVPRVECWFAHAEPEDRTAYERAFAPAVLRFGAPHYAFAFAREGLDTPLFGADPVLHDVLCEHATSTLRRLRIRSYTGRVLEIAHRELMCGTPTAFSVARQLGISARTLGRRLGVEGTTFSALLDRTRCEIALGYVAGDEMSLTEIAFRLGFSHVEALHRAFKRWTGQTPLSYRRAHELGNGGGFLTAVSSATWT